jgi:hypothetical protein
MKYKEILILLLIIALIILFGEFVTMINESLKNTFSLAFMGIEFHPAVLVVIRILYCELIGVLISIMIKTKIPLQSKGVFWALIVMLNIIVFSKALFYSSVLPMDQYTYLRFYELFSAGDGFNILSIVIGILVGSAILNERDNPLA